METLTNEANFVAAYTLNMDTSFFERPILVPGRD